MIELLSDPQVWLAFATLTMLEIVLGIDNIVFISILVGRLPKRNQASTMRIGLGMAMFMRIGLLLSITWVMGLTDTLITAFGNEISGRDLILLIGGAFLIAKSTMEIHESLEGHEHAAATGKKASVFGIIAQIAVIDIVFSLDSVITAVGLAEHVEVMIAAVIVSVVVMMIVAGPISKFVENHPTVKMLALSFLILIGFSLVGEGLDFHVPKGYVYFAMAFSVIVEFLNIAVKRRKKPPVQLRKKVLDK